MTSVKILASAVIGAALALSIVAADAHWHIIAFHLPW